MGLASIDEAVQMIETWCVRERLPWSVEAADRFGLYLSLILRYQERTNLVGVGTARGIAQELVLDSLRILRVLHMSGPIVDVGSGAGFPGIPLHVLYPDIPIHLVEPRTKRYAFLKLVGRELGFGMMEVHNSRIEQLEFDSVGVAISKAFARPKDWIALCMPWVHRYGAEIACYFSDADYERDVVPGLDSWWSDVYQENGRTYLVLRERKS